MSDLFSLLRTQIEANAWHAVEVYRKELAEYQSITADADDRIGILDFAIFIRRRTLDLAQADQPLTDDDLSAIAAVGRQRAELGLSVPSQQQVLGLHTGLMLREIHDAARPDDVNRLLQTVGWFGAQGVRARAAYLSGYTEGVAPSQSLATRTELVVRALLADESVEPFLASGVGDRMAQQYVVTMLRPAGEPPSAQVRTGMLRDLAGRRLLAAWLADDEFVLLTPGGGDTPRRRALAQARQVVAAIGRPCQVGSADGTAGRLADSLAWVRQASRVAPVEEQPTRLYGVADLFVEMSVAQAPEVDAWLRSFAQGLAGGPDLVSTLHAYYCHDMSRTATAAALRIHPRTLDYRLQRVRDLTGIDPGSTAGVRILSAAVTRLLAAGPS